MNPALTPSEARAAERCASLQRPAPLSPAPTSPGRPALIHHREAQGERGFVYLAAGGRKRSIPRIDTRFE